jgi:hypothetical protein
MTYLASEMDVGIIVPNEDRIKEGVLTQMCHDHRNIIGPLPMQDDSRSISFPPILHIGTHNFP